MFNHIASFIVGCEIAFWVVLAVGLVCRYLLRLRRTGTVLLALIPLIDVVLLAAVAVDLHNGAEVGWVHRAAGIYLGASVAFGPSVVRWADRRFAYHLAGGPKPERAPQEGPEAFRKECVDFGRWLLAAGISAAAVLGLGSTVANGEQASALYGIFPTLATITVIWLITGPVWVLGKQ
ncbi:hypothetical protein LSF60_04850 [Rhodococcus pyridinivorans]|uniref:hypothetical protein n=1 Tax=Rhodococcus pyridinivorans TaxID=103816 RepID=UPI001E429F33|nr:hypothetical protein [Rhodococcus pyridinivorans]UGQ58851.1 hypothetical protein LSF60_04850 [Rhodococcus pyridinivorans]